MSQTHWVLTKLIFPPEQGILDIHILVNFIITLSVSLYPSGLSFTSPSTSKQPPYTVDYPQTMPVNISLLILPIQHSYISIHTTLSPTPSSLTLHCSRGWKHGNVRIPSFQGMGDHSTQTRPMSR